MKTSENRQPYDFPVFHEIEKQQHRFPLINSEYEANDAAEPVLQIMRANINYHNLLALREYEYCSDDSAENRNHMLELEQYKQQVTELLQRAGQHGKKVAIEAEIRLRLV